MGSSTMTRRLVGVLGIAVLALSLSSAASWASPLFSKLPNEMSEGRYEPVAATLPDGNVLVAGGYPGESKSTNGAELFNPQTGTFETLAAKMTVRRGEEAYAALQNGDVLIAGGDNEGKALKSAELFNPTTNTFEALPAELNAERHGPAAALLHNGKVLIVGGANETTPGHELKTAELYNPETKTFEKLSAEVSVGRYEPVAVTLPNGKVLIAGGYNETTLPSRYLTSAELFNPETGTFETLPAEMSEARDEEAYVALQNGEVLIAGGYNEAAPSHYLKSAEVFNPTTNTFEKLSAEMNEERDGPAAALLHNGQVLIVGGYSEAVPAHYYLKSAEETSVTAPTAATLPASGVGMTTATLAGTVLSEAIGTAYFQYGTSTAYGASTVHESVAAALSASPVSVAVSGLSPRTTYHFRLVAENAGGPSYGTDQTFTTAPIPIITPTPPSVANASESRRIWREGNKLAQFSKKRPPVGTTFSFALNEQASVSFAFTQQVGARKVNGKCVAQTRKNRRKRACRRTVTPGTLSFTGHAGTNRVFFQGRASRSKLKPGSYTLVITATNAAGQHSSPKRLSFTIVT